LKQDNDYLEDRVFDCSQTTYEELKPLPNTEIIAHDDCSQTTYEELKLISLDWDFGIVRSSQTTYEELKPGYLREEASCCGAPRLPMRN